MVKDVLVIEDAAGVAHLKGQGGKGLCGGELPDGSSIETWGEKQFHGYKEACPECRVKLAQAVIDLLICGRLSDTTIGEATKYIMREGKVLKYFEG